MQIFITGGTGFIGQALVRKWLTDRHQITLLSRNPQSAEQHFRHRISAVDSPGVFSDFNGFDAVVNLAGEPIFNHRWTDEQKALIRQSRLNLTEKLTALINRSTQPPHCFISASATGYYGDKGQRIITESDAPGQSFTGQLCAQWEQAANQVKNQEKTRVCLLRTGMPLAAFGGMLGKILPLYRWGFGGKLGNGKQIMPWIALPDMIRAIDFLLQNPNCRGAFNLAAPNSVNYAEFNRFLGTWLHRPHFAVAPACLLRILFGERACLLLDSQNAYPEKLLQAGFQFRFPELKPYLQQILPARQKKRRRE